MNHYNGLPLIRKKKTDYEKNSSISLSKKRPGLKPLRDEYVPINTKLTDPTAIAMQECYVIKHEDPSFEKAYILMKRK